MCLDAAVISLKVVASYLWGVSVMDSQQRQICAGVYVLFRVSLWLLLDGMDWCITHFDDVVESFVEAEGIPDPTVDQLVARAVSGVPWAELGFSP